MDQTELQPSINGIEGYLIDICISHMYKLINEEPINKQKLENVLRNFQIIINICREKDGGA